MTILAFLGLGILQIYLWVAGPTPREIASFKDRAERSLQKRYSDERRSPDLEIQLRTDGVLLVNSELVTLSKLQETLMALVEQKEWVKVEVKAESDVAYGEAMQIVDLCKEVGVEEVSFATLNPM